MKNVYYRQRFRPVLGYSQVGVHIKCYLHVGQFVALPVPKPIIQERWSLLGEFRMAIIWEFEGGYNTF